MLDLEKSEFLNDAQIAKEQAPCVFNEKPSAEVSKHYTHIPTSKVINDMENIRLGKLLMLKKLKLEKIALKVGFQKDFSSI